MYVVECAREVMASGRVTPRKEVSMLFNSTLPLRFWVKVYAVPSGCWEWQGWKSPADGWGPGGYGRYWYKGTMRMAHRVSYFALVGPYPGSFTIDHLCRNPSCVNPKHLEPVPFGVNILRGNGSPAINKRKDACQNGHSFDLFNTVVRKGGSRRCRICYNRHQVEWRERNKQRGRR